MQEDNSREIPYLPTPSPTPSLRIQHRLSPVPSESAFSDQRNLLQIGAGLPGGQTSRQGGGIQEVGSSDDYLEERREPAVSKRRKKRKRRETSSAPDPNPARRISNRGGSK